MPANILLVEDEPAIQELIAVNLEHAGHHVIRARDAEGALGIVRNALPDLLLIDWMLPGMSGVALARQMRQEDRTKAIPIILLTARGAEADKVSGLEAGADDYVTKPFEPKELTARIRAMLRRARGFGTNPVMIQLGGRLEIVPDEGVVRGDGEEVHLTRTEFRLLCELAARPGRVFTREMLLETVWGYEYVGETKLVDVHIYRLRSKIERDPSHPKHVITVRGLGYKAAS